MVNRGWGETPLELTLTLQARLAQSGQSGGVTYLRSGVRISHRVHKPLWRNGIRTCLKSKGEIIQVRILSEVLSPIGGKVDTPVSKTGGHNRSCRFESYIGHIRACMYQGTAKVACNDFGRVRFSSGPLRGCSVEANTSACLAENRGFESHQPRQAGLVLMD